MFFIHHNVLCVFSCILGANGVSCNTVTYTERRLCAFKGSAVDISCAYPSYESVKSKFWFRSERRHQGGRPTRPVDLGEDSQYSGRVQVVETERGRSTLRINDLRASDSAEYRFTLVTPGFEWRSDLPGTTLTVTGKVHTGNNRLQLRPVARWGRQL